MYHKANTLLLAPLLSVCNCFRLTNKMLLRLLGLVGGVDIPSAPNAIRDNVIGGICNRGLKRLLGHAMIPP